MKSEATEQEVWTTPTLKKLDIDETAAGISGDADDFEIGSIS